jgi:hypothetical protein
LKRPLSSSSRDISVPCRGPEHYRSELAHSLQILCLQIRIVRQDLSAAQASGIELKDVSYTDARFAATLLVIGGDPLYG